MSKQPEALRLADALEHDPLKWCDEAAAELRRLNEEVETNGTIIQYHEASIARLTSQRDALLEALWVCMEHNRLHHGDSHNTVIQARAAIKAVEGENT